MKYLAIIGLAFMLSSCTQGLAVLSGADFACGELHIEGYFTDTEGDVLIAKVPEGWTAEEFSKVCPSE